jgi:hypothetical protein
MSEKVEYSPKMGALFELVAELTDLSHIMSVLGLGSASYNAAQRRRRTRYAVSSIRPDHA